MKWWPHLRLLAKGVGALARIAAAQERLADAAEGIERPLAVEPLRERITPAAQAHIRLSDAQLMDVEAIRTRYVTEKGYDPTPEELVKELDQVEYTPDDLRPDDRRRLGL